MVLPVVQEILGFPVPRMESAGNTQPKKLPGRNEDGGR